MVSAAVDLSILVEVDQVDQELVADAADEAGRVPANTMPRSRGEDGHVPSIDLATTLSEKTVFNAAHHHPAAFTATTEEGTSSQLLSGTS